MAAIDNLVTADWLFNHLSQADVKVLDATWLMPGAAAPSSKGYIPGAQVFDIDGVIAPSDLPHMLPTADVFSDAVSQMGIGNDDVVIVYDKNGISSAPRVWWTFKMFGHENVAVLDGGLPKWIAAGHPVDAVPAKPGPAAEYITGGPLIGLANLSDIETDLGTEQQIIDARSAERFAGQAKEPRPGLRAGHIPGSINIPYGHFFDDDKTLKDQAALRDLIKTAGIDLSEPVITTCGSGIAASGVALALARLGAADIRVYDGSWSEWGASDAPIETGHNKTG